MDVKLFELLFPLFVLGALAGDGGLEEGEVIFGDGPAVGEGGVVEIDLRDHSLTFSGSHIYYILRTLFAKVS